MRFSQLPRYSLRTMLVAMTLIAISLAAFGQRLAPRDRGLQTRSVQLLATDPAATEATVHAAMKTLLEETLALEGFVQHDSPFRAQLISPEVDSKSVTNQLVIERRDSTQAYERLISTRLNRRHPWNLVGLRLHGPEGRSVDVAAWYYTTPNTSAEAGVQVHIELIAASDRLNLTYAPKVAASLCRDAIERITLRFHSICEREQLQEVHWKQTSSARLAG